MAAVERTVESNGDHVYKINASLVHRLILVIIAAVISLGGYMVAWAFNDAGWKTKMTSDVQQLIYDMTGVKAKVDRGLLPIAEERLKVHDGQFVSIEYRLKRLEDKSHDEKR